MKVFVSYSRSEKVLALRLAEDLTRSGYDPWLDQARLAGGERWWDSIRGAISEAAVVLFLLSRASTSQDSVALKELEEALGRGLAVVPVRLERNIRPVLMQRGEEHRATEVLLERHWVDLDPSYEDGLADLLNSLHALRRERRSDRLRRRDEQLLNALAKSWRMLEVTTLEAGELLVVLNERRIEKQAYETILVTALYHLGRLRGDDGSVTSVAILNRFRAQGWVFEAVNRSKEILTTPVKELSLQIALDTHLW